MNTKKKNARGITLIALVITIIVLLILAGVTINALSGENGIITKSKEAKIKTEKSRTIEKINLAYSIDFFYCVIFIYSINIFIICYVPR